MHDEFNPPRKSLRELLMTVEDREIPDWVKGATDKELEDFIFQTAHSMSRHNVGLAERSRRQFNRLKEPHWSLTLGFIVAVMAMIFAAIAAWPVVREWFQHDLSVHKDANYQQPQSNSTPATTQELPALPQTTNVAPNTNLLKK